MLEDLDKLAGRIQQLVQQTRDLQNERARLLERITRMEGQYTALQDQQMRDHEEFNNMSARLANHEQEMQEIYNKAQQQKDDLEFKYQEQKNKSESLTRLLDNSETERDKLRLAASNAQQQIELILDKLPGIEA